MVCRGYASLTVRDLRITIVAGPAASVALTVVAGCGSLSAHAGFVRADERAC